MRFLISMVILVVLELVLASILISGILTGKGDNLFLGTILGIEFLVFASAMVAYLLAVLPARKVVEERGKGLLW